MTNYFLTTTFGPSKIISPFPFLFIWYSFRCSTLSERGGFVFAAKPETYESNSATWNTIMFLGLRGLEKGLVIDAEWNVIALLLQLSKWGGKQISSTISRTQDVSKKTFLLFHPPTHLYPINPFYHVPLPLYHHPSHKYTDFPNIRTSLSNLLNSDSVQSLFSFKTQLTSKIVKITGSYVL